MFQYASAKTHADRIGSTLSYGGKNVLISNFFDLDKKSTIQILLFKILCLQRWGRRRHKFTPQYIKYDDGCIGEGFDPNFHQIKPYTEICGWLQSEKYFYKNRPNVLKWFTPKQKYLNLINEIDGMLSAPLDFRCCIHVRRTDYAAADMGLSYKDQGWQLPLSYYYKAIELLPPTTSYVIISDDPDFAENAFSKLKNKYISRSPYSVVDMFLMTRCRINIISNSTFSWWGAWCNQIDNRLIIAPNYFLGFAKKFWFPSDIKVPEWQYIDVE